MAESIRDQHGTEIDHQTVTPRYSVIDEQSLDAGIEYLTNHGYAVFSNVMSDEEVTAHRNRLWNFLQNIPGQSIRRDQPDTWYSNWWRTALSLSRYHSPYPFRLGQVFVPTGWWVMLGSVNRISWEVFDRIVTSNAAALAFGKPMNCWCHSMAVTSFVIGDTIQSERPVRDGTIDCDQQGGDSTKQQEPVVFETWDQSCRRRQTDYLPL